VRKALRVAFNAIDSASTWAGKAVSWLLVGLILALTFDTFSRYLFSKPTVWAFDVSYMLGGTIMLMGMAWVTTRREQVRVDILYTRYSPKVRVLVDAFLNLFLFFPLFVMLLQRAIPRAMYAFTNKEFSEVGFWRPLMWPYRWMLVAALLLWVLAALTWVIRDLYKLKTGEEI
jgi:TRAP-type mannitol/chloroaromatic compound transport system permease small subunit